MRKLCKPSLFSLFTNYYFISSITFAEGTADFVELIFRRIFVALRRRRYSFVSTSNRLSISQFFYLFPVTHISNLPVKSSKTNAQNMYYLVFMQHAVYRNLDNGFFFRKFQLLCPRFFFQDVNIWTPPIIILNAVCPVLIRLTTADRKQTINTYGDIRNKTYTCHVLLSQIKIQRCPVKNI